MNEKVVLSSHPPNLIVGGGPPGGGGRITYKIKIIINKLCYHNISIQNSSNTKSHNKNVSRILYTNCK